MGATRSGIESRTRETTTGHVQLFEVREGAPLRRDSACELVGARVTLTQLEDLERRRHLLRQRPCVRDRISELAMLNGCLHNKHTLEAHVRQIKGGELRECCDIVRDGASKLVVAEVEFHERRREWFEHSQRLVERRPCARDRTSEVAMLNGRYAFWNRITHP